MYYILYCILLLYFESKSCLCVCISHFIPPHDRMDFLSGNTQADEVHVISLFSHNETCSDTSVCLLFTLSYIFETQKTRRDWDDLAERRVYELETQLAAPKEYYTSTAI